MASEQERTLREVTTEPMGTQQQKEPLTNERTIDFLMAEYSALREEITHRIDIEHQLISLALIAPGTLLAIGLQVRNASLIFLYPALALLLALVNYANAGHIHATAQYIEEKIESPIGDGHIGWQHYKIQNKNNVFYIIGALASRGVFVGTELLALIVGTVVAGWATLVNVLFYVGLLCTVLNVGFLLWLEGKARGWKRGFPRFFNTQSERQVS